MTDVKEVDTDELGDSNDSANVTAGLFKGHTAEEWYDRFSGQTRAVDKWKNENKILREKYEGALATHEDELSKVRSEFSGKTSKLTELEQALVDAQKKVADYEAQVTRFNADKQARSKIAEKFPALSTIYDQGDLRSITEFSDEAAYEGYLERMARLVTAEAKAQDYASGTIPKVGASGSQAAPRSAKQISDEMMALNTRDPEQKKKYEALRDELKSL